MMRLALVSDIHGNLPALEAVCADIRRRGVDAVINLGDSLSGPLLPRETADFLMAQDDWVHLAGNHERQVLHPGPRGREASDAHAHAQLAANHLAWIGSLPHSRAFSNEVWLCHGTPRSDCEYFLESVDAQGVRLATRAEVDQRLGGVQAELVACGHTHLPRALCASSGVRIVNPGSVGLPAYDDDHPCAHVVQNGSPDARYALAERSAAGRWTLSLLAVPYDFAPMAELARKNGRPEWAMALATGYLA